MIKRTGTPISQRPSPVLPQDAGENLADLTARGDAELYRVDAERVKPATASPPREHHISVGVGA